MPSPSQFLGHLLGQASIGISPLRADNTIRFGAIDIDDYKGNINDIIEAIYHYNLPICPCYSKSKKLHLYFFFAEDSSAESAVAIMQWYRVAFACDPKTEVFPKQVKRSARNKAYSWINLPYFSCDDMSNHRKMVGKDGSVQGLNEFLSRADESRLSIEDHWQAIKELEWWDAPPCILSGLMLRNVAVGGRNIWFYSLVVFLKLKDEDDSMDIEDKVLTYNSMMKDPLPEAELKATVLTGVDKQTGFYACKQMPDRCDKSFCLKQKFGVGSNKATGLEYGQMTQILTDPPTYEWIISGKKLAFDSEKALLGQEQFRGMCLRELHFVPKLLEPNVWAKVLNKSASKMVMRLPPQTEGDLTLGSMFFDATLTYFTPQRKGATMALCTMGRIFEDGDWWWFTASHFMKYVTEVKGLRELKRDDVRKRLLDMGALMDGGLWKMPKSSLQSQLEKLKSKVVTELDLSDNEGTSNDF